LLKDPAAQEQLPAAVIENEALQVSDLPVLMAQTAAFLSTQGMQTLLFGLYEPAAQLTIGTHLPLIKY